MFPNIQYDLIIEYIYMLNVYYQINKAESKTGTFLYGRKKLIYRSNVFRTHMQAGLVRACILTGHIFSQAELLPFAHPSTRSQKKITNFKVQ